MARSRALIRASLPSNFTISEAPAVVVAPAADAGRDPVPLPAVGDGVELDEVGVGMRCEQLFDGGVVEGRGTFTFADGSAEVGRWEDGLPVVMKELLQAWTMPLQGLANALVFSLWLRIWLHLACHRGC